MLRTNDIKPSTSSQQPESNMDTHTNQDEIIEQVDNSTSVLHKMASLYSEQLMSDITLVVDGRNYPAHRLILCATSDVFWVMLMNREWTEFNESTVNLQETQMCADVFPQFLRYFYTGQIRISLATVIPVLCLADKYNVKDLINLCLDYMTKNTALAGKTGHIVSWLQYALNCGHYQVAMECQSFVKWNFEMVAETKEFFNFDHDILISLLQSSDLVVLNEFTLYKHIDKWLCRQKERIMSESDLSEEQSHAHWLSMLTQTLQHIRFPMMCPRQLAGLLLSPLTQEHNDFFVERMAMAMSYQSGQAEGFKKWLNKDTRDFTPRMYTDDNWGSLLIVESFHCLSSYDVRTFIFSTRAAIAEKVQIDVFQDKLLEWTVDLYPKGVWFKKSKLILWARMYDVPEVVLRTVRLALTCRNPPDSTIQTDVRVKIGILVWGVQQGVEHILAKEVRVHRFSSKEPVLNVDDALHFDMLNHPLYTPDEVKIADNSSVISRHLVGPERDQLKIQVVIMPLTHVSIHDD